MIVKSTWLHLRIPFSFFLLPVFLFALAVSPNPQASQTFWVFFIVHFLLYPASNGYNSYFDKDEKSIGGLKNPPPVSKSLYYTALIFDGVALILGFFLVNGLFAFMLLIYGLVSKAYSHPAIRIKKYPFLSWFIAGSFQGCFSFLMCYAGINDLGWEPLGEARVLVPALLTSVTLWGSYPMTQIYQHEEDIKRGDKTLSYMLGVRGTFYFTAILFAFSTIGFGWYFHSFLDIDYFYQYLLFLGPVLLFFSYWFTRVYKNPEAADFTYTMWLNGLSSFCLNAFFIYLFFASNS